MAAAKRNWQLFSERLIRKNCVIILGHFVRFLDGAFSRRSLMVSEYRTRFQYVEFFIGLYNLFELVWNLMIYLSILLHWCLESIDFQTGIVFFLFARQKFCIRETESCKKDRFKLLNSVVISVTFNSFALFLQLSFTKRTG